VPIVEQKLAIGLTVRLYMEKKIPFPAIKSSKAFSGAMKELVNTLHTKNVYKVLSPRNVEHLHHGLGWRTHSGDESAKELTTLKEHRVEHSIKFEEIVLHKLELIPSTIGSILEAMQSQLMTLLYSKVSESTEKSGNVVSVAKMGSSQEAFLEMLRKIEFGTDEHGKVTLPEIHLAPGNPLLNDLKLAGPEFEAKADAIIQEKSLAALQRERDRVSKFKA
jgi:hypothetical protein